MLFDRPARLAAALAILLGLGVIVLTRGVSLPMIVAAVIAGAAAMWLISIADPLPPAPAIVAPEPSQQIFLDALGDPALHLRD